MNLTSQGGLYIKNYHKLWQISYSSMETEWHMNTSQNVETRQKRQIYFARRGSLYITYQKPQQISNPNSPKTLLETAEHWVLFLLKTSTLYIDPNTSRNFPTIKISLLLTLSGEELFSIQTCPTTISLTGQLHQKLEFLGVTI